MSGPYIFLVVAAVLVALMLLELAARARKAAPSDAGQLVRESQRKSQITSAICMLVGLSITTSVLILQDQTISSRQTTQDRPPGWPSDARNESKTKPKDIHLPPPVTLFSLALFALAAGLAFVEYAKAPAPPHPKSMLHLLHCGVCQEHTGAKSLVVAGSDCPACGQRAPITPEGEYSYVLDPESRKVVSSRAERRLLLRVMTVMALATTIPALAIAFPDAVDLMGGTAASVENVMGRIYAKMSIDFDVFGQRAARSLIWATAGIPALILMSVARASFIQAILLVVLTASVGVVILGMSFVFAEYIFCAFYSGHSTYFDSTVGTGWLNKAGGWLSFRREEQWQWDLLVSGLSMLIGVYLSINTVGLRFPLDRTWSKNFTSAIAIASTLLVLWVVATMTHALFHWI